MTIAEQGMVIALESQNVAQHLEQRWYFRYQSRSTLNKHLSRIALIVFRFVDY